MSPDTALDGVLVVDKPQGPTSHDVVACVRRAIGQKKVGHLGTLDPMATGVLPVAIGRATRLAPWLTTVPKQYRAVIRLGLVTDTYDVTGTEVGGARALDPEAIAPTASAISEALAGFAGETKQLPPPVSAKKVGGVRAYRLARRKQPVDLKPVAVRVEELTLLSVDGWHLTCRIRSSSGYYVRSLAHDLGQRLGCGGCLEALTREAHGNFVLADGVPLAEIVDGPGDREEARARLARRRIGLDHLLPELPAVKAIGAGERRARHGNPLRPMDLDGALIPPETAAVRVVDDQGHLLCLARPNTAGHLQPQMVLATPHPD